MQRIFERLWPFNCDGYFLFFYFLFFIQIFINKGTTLIVYPFAGILKEVDLLSPRLLINREATGPFKDINKNTMNYRDVFQEGDCDDGTILLAEYLGFKEELLQWKWIIN